MEKTFRCLRCLMTLADFMACFYAVIPKDWRVTLSLHIHPKIAEVVIRQVASVLCWGLWLQCWRGPGTVVCAFLQSSCSILLVLNIWELLFLVHCENVYIKRRQWFCVYASIWAGVCMCVWHRFSLSVVSDSLQPCGLQHARPPCPSPTPGAYSNSRQ